MSGACLCVRLPTCLPACLPAACLWMNKGVFCTPTPSPPSYPPSLTFYYELLGDWQKRKSCPALYALLSPPSSTDPSIPHPCLPPSLEPAFVSSPFLYQIRSRCLPALAAARAPIQCWWCLGNRVCTQTRTLSLYSQLFIVPALSFTRCKTPALR